MLIQLILMPIDGMPFRLDQVCVMFQWAVKHWNFDSNDAETFFFGNWNEQGKERSRVTTAQWVDWAKNR